MAKRKSHNGGARKRLASSKPTAAQWWLQFDLSGDYETDEDRGAEHGRKVLQDMLRTGFTPLLGHVVRHMIETKCPDSFVIGFCHEISSAAYRGGKQ